MFLYSHWLKLPINTRIAIAIAFNIQKKGSTEVFNNEVIRDGYPIGDIEQALNIDAIQKYLGSDETDFNILWEQLIAKIEGRATTVAAAPIIPSTTIETSPQVPSAQAVASSKSTKVTKKRGRPSKK